MNIFEKLTKTIDRNSLSSSQNFFLLLDLKNSEQAYSVIYSFSFLTDIANNIISLMNADEPDPHFHISTSISNSDDAFLFLKEMDFEVLHFKDEDTALLIDNILVDNFPHRLSFFDFERMLEKNNLLPQKLFSLVV